MDSAMRKKMSPQYMTQYEYDAMLTILQECAAHSLPRQRHHGVVSRPKQKQRSGWSPLVSFFVFVGIIGIIAWLAYPSPVSYTGGF